MIAAGVLLLIALPAIAFGNNVTRLFFVIVLIVTANGYGLGATKVAAVFAGLLLGALIGTPLGRLFEGVISTILGTTGLSNRIASILLMSLAVVAGASFGLQYPLRKWISRFPKVQKHDRLIGAGLGLFEGSLLGLLVIWAVLAMEPVATTSIAQAKRDQSEGGPPPSALAESIVEVAHEAKESAVGQIAQATNPLSELKFIALFQKIIAVLNHFEAREAFLAHEAIKEIRSRESIQKALEMLKTTPEVKVIMEGDGSITGEQLKAIMDSPQVLKVLDQTGLVGEMKPLYGAIETAVDDAFKVTERSKPAAP